MGMCKYYFIDIYGCPVCRKPKLGSLKKQRRCHNNGRQCSEFDCAICLRKKAQKGHLCCSDCDVVPSATDKPIEAKQDKGKPRPSLVPPQLIYDVAEVREYGCKKYGDPESWRQVELQRYIDALYRHMLEFVADPVSKDGESGLHHYKHMACNIAFICELMRKDT
ncbi:MAG: DUF5664 domain-containing protein [Oscillospiraceae bacterium]|nr:DUF5664 domain-containing protein [Oscillospiraceae bacterium]